MIYFPEVVDNTIRSAFLRCPKKARFEFIDNLVPHHHTDAQHAANVLRAGLTAARKAYFLDTASKRAAMEAGHEAMAIAWPSTFNDHSVSLHDIIAAFDTHMARWPMDRDSIHPAVYESRLLIGETILFSLPLSHPITFKPVKYAVHIDMIGIDQETGSVYVLCDELLPTLRESSAYNLDAAYTEKSYAANHLLLGIEAACEVREVTTLYQTGMVIVNRPKWMLDQWYAQIVADFSRMLKQYQQARFDANLGDACHGCGYRPLCEAQRAGEVLTKFIDATWSAKSGERQLL